MSNFGTSLGKVAQGGAEDAYIDILGMNVLFFNEVADTE
jgi:hypothetical protein